MEDVAMSYLNFEEIKAENAIADVVQRLGINVNKSGASLRGKCPVCESSGDRNLAVTPEKSLWYCFTAGKGGDVIALVAHVKGISVKAAGEWLQGSPTQDSPKGGHKAKEKETKGEEPSAGFKPLEYIQHDHEAVLALGFSVDDAERLGIGYVGRGVFKGKVVVPVRLTDGKLTGYIAVTECFLPPSWRF